MSKSLDKDPLYQQLLLSLPMREGTGAATTADVAKPHHPIVLTHAPAWTQLASSGIYVLTLDGANDLLSCVAASCTDLDFVAGAFSIAVWVSCTGASTDLIRRCVDNTSGWALKWASATTSVSVVTCQAGATQTTVTNTDMAASTWTLIGISRSGTSVRIYRNGIDDVVTVGSHTNPATSAGNLLIGANSAGAAAFTGSVGRPRIWGRALAPHEHMSIWKRERHLFQV